jgi:hypothetical protein
MEDIEQVKALIPISNNTQNTIDLIVDEMKNSIGISDSKIESRAKKLSHTLIKKFGTEAAALLSGSFINGIIKPAVIGYLMGQPSLVYLQLHAVIERAAILLLPQLITKNPLLASKENIVISELLQRKTLPDLVSILVELEVLQKEDKSVVADLNKKRNAIAHYNPDKIAKHFNDGIDINTAKIYEVIQKDQRTHIVITNAVDLLYKLSKAET